MPPPRQTQLLPFDTDYWIRMAYEDPPEFKRRYGDALKTLIESVPPSLQKRLNGLRWQVEMEIRQAQNRLEAQERVQRLLADAVYGPEGLLGQISRMGTDVPDQSAVPPASAVVSFTQAARRKKNSGLGSG